MVAVFVEATNKHHLFRVLFLQPLDTSDGLLLRQFGGVSSRGSLVARLCLFSQAPRRGTSKIFRV